MLKKLLANRMAMLICAVFLVITCRGFITAFSTSKAAFFNMYEPIDAENLMKQTTNIEEAMYSLQVGVDRYHVIDPALSDYFMGYKKILENNFLEAEQYFKSSVEKGLKRSDYETAQYSQARLLELAARYSDIPKLLKASKNLEMYADKTPGKWDDLLAVYGYALTYYYQIDDEQSNRYLNQLAAEALEYNDSEMQGLYWLQKGYMQTSYENYEKAHEYYLKAEEILKSAPCSNPFENPCVNAQIMRLESEAELNSGVEYYIGIEGEFNSIIGEVQNKVNKTSILYDVYYTKGEIEELYGKNAESLLSLQTAHMYLKQINHVKSDIDPATNIEHDLARAYFNNNQFFESAKLYVKLQNIGESAQYIEVSNQTSTSLRSFGETALEEEIDVLSELKEAQTDRLKKQQLIIVLAIGLIVVLIILALMSRREMRRIKALQNEIYQKSITDALTQIPNRGRILQVFEEMPSEDGIIALMDVDNFKRINDTFGHIVGDEVLKKIAQTVKMSIREQDEVGRYGGEEFLVVLKERNMEKAIRVVERIRFNIENLQWSHGNLKTTVSIGVVRQLNRDSDEILSEADYLLYKAKEEGKNKIVCGN